MMFTQVSMKELAGILIHARKVIKFKVSFLMLLLMCLWLLKNTLNIAMIK